MIGSFPSSATASLVAKNGTQQNYFTTVDISSPVDRFWCLRCLKDHIEVSDMIGLFASSATASLVAKNGTKENFSNVSNFIHNLFI